MVFEVNDQGEIYSTMHDPHGNLTYALSQATELSDGRVALGSYAAPYLAISNKFVEPYVAQAEHKEVTTVCSDHPSPQE